MRNLLMAAVSRPTLSALLVTLPERDPYGEEDVKLTGVQPPRDTTGVINQHTRIFVRYDLVDDHIITTGGA